MFMEPESGLGWYEAETQTMHLVLGTQSTNGDVRDGTELFADPDCPITVRTVRLTSCYPGGGFGGRDESPFSPLVMLAAAYAGGPVRVSRDRFEQFQAGVKNPGATIEQMLAIDADGHFQAIESVLQLEAGGKNNYSQFVAALAGYSAGGGYRIPRVAVDATAQPSQGVVAGSMRGFGGPPGTSRLQALRRNSRSESSRFSIGRAPTRCGRSVNRKNDDGRRRDRCTVWGSHSPTRRTERGETG
jgi:CO/xanthine dehydrogenase Mo-binding subunit